MNPGSDNAAPSGSIVKGVVIGMKENQQTPNTTRPTFVSLQEKKELVPGVKQSRSRGSGSYHTYMVKFFLVDSAGSLHYAATGIDGGDSHYEYTNEAGFPPLQCHNKSVSLVTSRRRVVFDGHSHVVCDLSSGSQGVGRTADTRFTS